MPLMDSPLLDSYVDELLKWNKKVNLIGRKRADEIRELHIADSLFLLPYLRESEIKLWVDIGSGGGLPAVPLSIALPEHHFIMTDVVNKKLRFLEWVVAKLGLNADVSNPTGIQGNITDQPCGVISRAYGSIRELMEWSKRYTPNALEYYFLKGRVENAERELKEAGIERYRIDPQDRGSVVVIRPN